MAHCMRILPPKNGRRQRGGAASPSEWVTRELVELVGREIPAVWWALFGRETPPRTGEQMSFYEMFM